MLSYVMCVEEEELPPTGPSLLSLPRCLSSLCSATQQSATTSFQQLVTDTQNYRGSSWNQVNIVENVQYKNKSENQQKVRNERIIPIAQNLTKPELFSKNGFVFAQFRDHQ